MKMKHDVQLIKHISECPVNSYSFTVPLIKGKRGWIFQQALYYLLKTVKFLTYKMRSLSTLTDAMQKLICPCHYFGGNTDLTIQSW